MIEGAPDETPSFWSIFGSSKAKELPPSLADAVLAAAFEHDAFVADRAAKLLPNVIKANASNDAALEKIAQKLADSPEQLQKIIVASQGNPRLTGGEDHSQETFAPLAKPAKEWLKQKDARQVARAAVILGRFAPTELNDRMGELLGSSDATVRLIALLRRVSVAGRLSQNANRKGDHNLGGERGSGRRRAAEADCPLV